MKRLRVAMLRLLSSRRMWLGALALCLLFMLLTLGVLLARTNAWERWTSAPIPERQEPPFVASSAPHPLLKGRLLLHLMPLPDESLRLTESTPNRSPRPLEERLEVQLGDVGLELVLRETFVQVKGPAGVAVRDLLKWVWARYRFEVVHRAGGETLVLATPEDLTSSHGTLLEAYYLDADGILIFARAMTKHGAEAGTSPKSLAAARALMERVRLGDRRLPVGGGRQQLESPEPGLALELTLPARWAVSTAVGTDFVQHRCHPISDGEGAPEGIGIYLGAAPRFMIERHDAPVPKGSAKSRPGLLMGQETVWHQWESRWRPGVGSALWMETVLPLTADESLQVHVYCRAEDRTHLEALQAMIGTLERVQALEPSSVPVSP